MRRARGKTTVCPYRFEWLLLVENLLPLKALFRLHILAGALSRYNFQSTSSPSALSPKSFRQSVVRLDQSNSHFLTISQFFPETQILSPTDC